MVYVLISLLLGVSDLTNVALNKVSTMSSLDSTDGLPQRANDGSNRTDTHNCARTAQADVSPYRWWRVDLAGVYQIWYADITNRGDCCGLYTCQASSGNSSKQMIGGGDCVFVCVCVCVFVCVCLCVCVCVLVCVCL